jgi:hypothetical protein
MFFLLQSGDFYPDHNEAFKLEIETFAKGKWQHKDLRLICGSEGFVSKDPLIIFVYAKIADWYYGETGELCDIAE